MVRSIHALVLSTSIAWLGGAGPLGASECPGKLDTETLSPSVLVACIMELRTEVREIRSEGVGMIAAFPHSCPIALGWNPYVPAGGRTIVGAGKHGNFGADGSALTNYQAPSGEEDADLIDPKDNPKVVGGIEMRTLSIDQLPSHTHITRHQFMQAAGDKDSNRIALMEDGVSSRGKQIATEPAGAGDAYNTMPPYIALHFCKKEAN